MCVCVCWMLKYFICLFIPFHNHPIIIYWNEKHPIELSCLFQAMAPGSSKVHQAEHPNLGCPWRESAARPPAVAFPSSDPHHGISRHVFWPSLAFYLAPIRIFFLASVLAFYLDSIWHSISGILFLSSSQYYFVLQSLHKVLPSKACTKCFPVPVLLRTAKFAQSTPQYYFGTAHPISKRSKPRSADNGEHSSASRTRRTNEAPHIDAGSHFMWETSITWTKRQSLDHKRQSHSALNHHSVRRSRYSGRAQARSTAFCARDMVIGPRRSRHTPQPPKLAIYSSGPGVPHSIRSWQSRPVEGTEEKKEEWGCTFVKMAGGEKKMLMSWRKRKKPMVTCEKPWKTHEKNNGKPVGEKIKHCK